MRTVWNSWRVIGWRVLFRASASFGTWGEKGELFWSMKWVTVLVMVTLISPLSWKYGILKNNISSGYSGGGLALRLSREGQSASSASAYFIEDGTKTCVGRVIARRKDGRGVKRRHFPTLEKQKPESPWADEPGVTSLLRSPWRTEP